MAAQSALQRLRAVKGMPDRIADARLFRHVIQQGVRVAHLHNLDEIQTPILEYANVYERTLGQDSDVVNKELYQFADKNGRLVTMRPEGTAGIARAIITNGLLQSLPHRYYYHGPMFRYESPQRGRMRQFDQFGAEWIGLADPAIDAEAIGMAWDYLARLGLGKEITVEINTLGDFKSRKNYRQVLGKYLTEHRQSLSSDSQARLDRGSLLRVLDSKDVKDRQLMKRPDFPSLHDSLTPTARKRFDTILSLLDARSSPLNVRVKPTLVRGLDYYTHTIFEIIHTPHRDQKEVLGASQSTLLAGGRYDGLIETMASQEPVTNADGLVPCVGWAAGINRLMMILAAKKWTPVDKLDTALLIYVPSDDADALIRYGVLIKDRLRRSNVRPLESVGNLTMADGFAAPAKQLARLLKQLPKERKNLKAFFIGDDEVRAQSVGVKDLDSGQQRQVLLSDLSSIFEGGEIKL